MHHTLSLGRRVSLPLCAFLYSLSSLPFSGFFFHATNLLPREMQSVFFHGCFYATIAALFLMRFSEPFFALARHPTKQSASFIVAFSPPKTTLSQCVNGEEDASCSVLILGQSIRIKVLELLDLAFAISEGVFRSREPEALSRFGTPPLSEIAKLIPSSWFVLVGVVRGATIVSRFTLRPLILVVVIFIRFLTETTSC